MASKARGGLSKREWERANPGQKAPSDRDKKKSSSKAGIPKVDTSQLKALQGKFTESLAPTQQETEAQTQLGNVITSKELGIQKVEQKPMAQKFITGQSAGLEKSAALKSLPLQTRLANLQARRQSAADVLKAQLGFETSNIDRQTGLAESAASRSFQQQQADISQSQFGQTFGEGQRQFDVTNSLAQQQENRLGNTKPGDDDDDKEINAAYTEADSLRKQLINKEIDWGYAWGRMKDRFPNASTEFIDKALGVDLRGY